MSDGEMVPTEEEPEGDHSPPFGARVKAILTSGKAKILYICAVIGVGLLGLAVVSFILAGPISTALYAFLFLMGALGIPTTVMFLSPSFTRGFRSAFGKLHFIMGQVTYGGGFLVEFDNRWEMCPTRATDNGIEVYIEDEWRGPVTGEENMSVLGWQRFGVLRNKEDDTYEAIRYDGAATDGGTGVERGGHSEVPPPTNTDGLVFDLKRIWSAGLQKIGDIGLIEKAEEVAMRNEAKDGMTSGWEPIIGAFVGLLLGTGTAYVLL